MTGLYTVTMDQKGRVVVPHAFASYFGTHCAIIRADEGLAVLMTVTAYEDLCRTQAPYRWGRWWLASGWVLPLCDTNPNRPGWHSRRVLLPGALRREMKLYPGSDVVFAGQGGWALMMTPEAWKDEQKLLYAYMTEERERVWMLTRHVCLDEERARAERMT